MIGIIFTLLYTYFQVNHHKQKAHVGALKAMIYF